jgi:hypothetical protein
MTLEDKLAALADDAIVRVHDPVSDETFIRCLVCGEWEGHTDICPLPAIERWAKPEPPAPAPEPQRVLPFVVRAR